MYKQSGYQKKINSIIMSLILGLMSSFFSPMAAYADFNPLAFSETGELPDFIQFGEPDRNGYVFYVDNNFRLNQNYVMVYGELPSTFRTEKNKSANLVIHKTYYDCKKRLYKVEDLRYHQLKERPRPGDTDWRLVEFYEGPLMQYEKIPPNSFISQVADWFCHHY